MIFVNIFLNLYFREGLGQVTGNPSLGYGIMVRAGSARGLKLKGSK